MGKFLTENSNVAVFGIGCVGLSVLQGCRAKKCAKIIAVDTNPHKKEWAMKFGASKGVCLLFSLSLGTDDSRPSATADFVNPKDLPEGTSIVDKLVEMTDGGCDFTFDATGNVSSCSLA